MTERLHFHTLEKEMATHSRVLAWRIPGLGEPGGLPSVGWHRVGHDWSDLAAAAAAAFPPFFSLSGFSFAAMPFAHPLILNFSEVFFRCVCCEQRTASYAGEVSCLTVWHGISCVYGLSCALYFSYLYLVTFCCSSGCLIVVTFFFKFLFIFLSFKF